MNYSVAIPEIISDVLTEEEKVSLMNIIDKLLQKDVRLELSFFPICNRPTDLIVPLPSLESMLERQKMIHESYDAHRQDRSS